MKHTFILAFGLFLMLPFFSEAQVAGLPKPDHIVILIEENEASTGVICNTCSSFAPYLNALAADTNSAVFTNMSAMDHPSQPNYLEYYAGYNPSWPGYAEGGLNGDDSVVGWPFTSVNLGSQLLQAGLSFKTYSQDLPYAGFEGNTYAPSYARKHNPVTNWQGTGLNQVPDSLNQPFTDWPDSSHFDLLPTICYVVPDEDSDMHNGTGNTPITIGDWWFHNYLGNLLPWCLANNTLLIVTFDESNTLSLTTNIIPTIFYGPMVKGGTYNQPATLYSQLRTFEDMYGLNNYGGYPGASADSTPITYCWKSTATAINQVNQNKPGLYVYPNPSNSDITFDARALNDVASELSITDLTGKEIAGYKLSAQALLHVNTTDFAGGLYLYRLKQTDGTTQSGKFIVTH
jgi:phosphatidylinositol-3-phosphatase